MINLDMVGRLKDNKLTIGGIGTASEWKGLIRIGMSRRLTEALRVLNRPNWENNIATCPRYLRDPVFVLQLTEDGFLAHPIIRRSTARRFRSCSSSLGRISTITSRPTRQTRSITPARQRSLTISRRHRQARRSKPNAADIHGRKIVRNTRRTNRFQHQPRHDPDTTPTRPTVCCSTACVRIRPRQNRA